jgi:hypothetical protein
VTAVVPESLVDTLRAAEADAAMDELGESIPWEQVKAELRPVKCHGVAAYAIDIRSLARRSLRQLECSSAEPSAPLSTTWPPGRGSQT